MKQKKNLPQLAKMVKYLCEKNYAEANKYLKEAAEIKMKQRIKKLL